MTDEFAREAESGSLTVVLAFVFVTLVVVNGYVNLLWPLAVLKEWRPDFFFATWPRGIRLLILLLGGGIGYLLGNLLYSPLIRANADVQIAVYAAWAVFAYVLLLFVGLAFVEKSYVQLGPIVFFIGLIILLAVLGPLMRAPATAAAVLVAGAALAAIAYVAF